MTLVLRQQRTTKVVVLVVQVVLHLLLLIWICSCTVSAALFVITPSKITQSSPYYYDLPRSHQLQQLQVKNNFAILLLLPNQKISNSFIKKQIESSLQRKKKKNHTVLYASTASFTSSNNNDNNSIRSGDAILVIGGTGGVGQLVSKKLSSGVYGNYKVRVTSRNVERGQEILDTDNDTNIEVVPLDLVSTSDMEKQLQNALQDVSAVVVSIGTTAFPTTKWMGGNTPQAIDDIAVTKIAQITSSSKNNIKKIILITSIGVDRKDIMPFKILNLFGVLDSKKKGEQAIMNCGIPYVIIRPGRLVGGPFTNIDIAKLLQVQGGPGNGCDISIGDTLLGDCKREVCSEAVIQCLLASSADNIDFSIISNGNKPTFSNTNEWYNELSKLQK